MTIEERFERIEHLTAGMAEERRRDREEDRQLWRDTQRQISDLAQSSQRQIDQLTQKIADTNSAITRMGDEMRAADRRSGERIEAVNDALSRRIAEMVSGIGEWMRTGGKQSNT